MNLIKNKQINYLYVIGNTYASTLSSNIFINNLIKEAVKHKLKKYVDYKGIWNTKFKEDKIIKEYNKLGPNKFLNIPSKSGTIIYGDYVAFLFTTDKPYVIEIKNKFIAEEMKSYFNHLWKLAKP